MQHPSPSMPSRSSYRIENQPGREESKTQHYSRLVLYCTESADGQDFEGKWISWRSVIANSEEGLSSGRIWRKSRYNCELYKQPLAGYPSRHHAVHRHLACLSSSCSPERLAQRKPVYKPIEYIHPISKSLCIANQRLLRYSASSSPPQLRFLPLLELLLDIFQLLVEMLKLPLIIFQNLLRLV